MKALLLLSIAAPLAILHAQTGDPRIRDAATHDQLAKTRMQALQAGPQVKLEPAKGKSPDASTAVPDLMSRADILCYNGMATLVPKRAILNQPAGVVARINQYQQGSKMVNWLEFITNNRGWITTLEVSKAQARGKTPIDEKVVEQYRKSSNLVVATLAGNPISVLPPAEPKADPATAPSQPPIPSSR